MKQEKFKEISAGMVGLIVIMLAIKFIVGSADEPQVEPETQKDVVEATEPEKEISKIPEVNIKIAVDTIKEHPDVRYAAVTQKGSELSLSIIINQSISQRRAQELGDDFIRMVMSNAGRDFENAPEGKQIGASRFSYLVGIYRIDKSEVALGAKVSSAKWITW